MKTTITLLLFLLFSLIVEYSSAELYKYVDKNGTIVFTDDATNVPSDQINQNKATSSNDRTNQYQEKAEKVQSEKPNVNVSKSSVSADQNSQLNNEQGVCNKAIKENLLFCRNLLQKKSTPNTTNGQGFSKEENIVLTYAVCSHHLLQEELTDQEKSEIKRLGTEAKVLEKDIDKEKLYTIKEWMPKWLWGYCDKQVIKEYTRQELDELGKYFFSNIWLQVSTLLASKDIKKAVSYYHETVQSNWQKQFETWPPEELRKLANGMKSDQIYVESVESDAQATCNLISIVEGKRYSFQLIFRRGLNNEWKIYKY